MNKIIIDSSAWIEYFSGSNKGKRIRAYINQPETDIWATGLIAAEVATKFMKDGISPDNAIMAIKSASQLVNFDFNLGMETAKIFVSERKKKGKFGLADAHVLAAAHAMGAKVLTCDFDFSGINNAIVIK